MVYYELYDCVYSASGFGKIEGEDRKYAIDVKLGHYACFSSAYTAVKNYDSAELTYKIYLLAENYDGSNFNLCSKLETKKILRCLRQVVPFSYKFTKETYTRGAYNKKQVLYYVLNITIKGTAPQHIWLTSMLRCFFEWPYNVAAKEACELQSKIQSIDGINLTKENWINLYLTIATQLGSSGLHGLADKQRQPKLKTYNNWKKTISSLDPHVSVINGISSGKHFSANTPQVAIDCEQVYSRGIESRASQYVMAYKDKLSWKKTKK